MQVVAAVIERDGQILICQRKIGRRHALKWEFPGGKIEPGEDSPTALARELREELQIDAAIGPLLHTETVRYPNGSSIRLEFFRVTQFSGEPHNTEFERMVWEHPDKLLSYDFLDGDIAFLKKLTGDRNQTPLAE